MKPKITAMVAMTKDNVIGDGKKLLWNIPKDMKRVRELTMHSPLIMGRKTYDSIGKPLDGRLSIVLTRNENFNKVYDNDYAVRAASINDAIRLATDWINLKPARQEKNNIIIFGGAEIYELGLPYCDRIDVTRVDMSFNNPNLVRFPNIDLNKWKLESTEKNDEFSSEIFIRR